MANNKYKKNRKTKLIARFIKVFLLALIIFSIIAAIGTFAYVKMANQNAISSLNKKNATGSGSENSLVDEKEVSILNEKKITTVAVMGVDAYGYRTDVVMLAFFHHMSGDIDIVSVPRDTLVKIPDDIYKEITSKRSGVNQYSRINNIPAYVKKDKRNETSVAVMENVFGIDIDYYMTLDLEGFKNIVDAVGPIPFYVPMNMNYSALDQDPPLVINLKKGEQKLDGAHAEQLIRYRAGYANADLGRISVQHDFMKAFIDELLNPDERYNIMSIVETVMTQVDTNFVDILDYVIYLDKISADKISMVTLPGGNGRHGSYAYDPKETKKLFESILNKDNEVKLSENDNETDVKKPVVEVEPIVPVEKEDYTISVQNGTKVSGLAGRTKTKLEKEGFKVGEAVNYDKKDLEKSIIKASNRELAEMLAENFKDPEIIIDETLDKTVVLAIGNKDNDK